MRENQSVVKQQWQHDIEATQLSSEWRIMRWAFFGLVLCFLLYKASCAPLPSEIDALVVSDDAVARLYGRDVRDVRDCRD